MPDLNLALNYFRHRKTRRVARLLGEGAEVFPLRLWCYVAESHPLDGRLVGYTADEIEELAGWSGDRGLFMAAMLEVGWLHPIVVSQRDGYQCHEWEQHQAHFKRFSRLSAEGVQSRQAATRAGPPHGATSGATDGCTACATDGCTPRLPARPTYPPSDPSSRRPAGSTDQPTDRPTSQPAGPAAPSAPGELRPPQDGTAADAVRRGDEGATGQLACGSNTGPTGQQLACGSKAGVAALAAELRPPQDGTAADAVGAVSGVTALGAMANEALTVLRNEAQKGQEDAPRRYVPPPSRKVTEVEERRLMHHLRQLLGDREMDAKGGHWRDDWVRCHPSAVVRAIVALETAIRERPMRGQEPIVNRAAWLEATLTDWKRNGRLEG